MIVPRKINGTIRTIDVITHRKPAICPINRKKRKEMIPKPTPKYAHPIFGSAPMAMPNTMGKRIKSTQSYSAIPRRRNRRPVPKKMSVRIMESRKLLSVRMELMVNENYTKFFVSLIYEK